MYIANASSFDFTTFLLFSYDFPIQELVIPVIPIKEITLVNPPNKILVAVN